MASDERDEDTSSLVEMGNPGLYVYSSPELVSIDR